MRGQRTAPFWHMTERQKARVRLPLLSFLALIGPPLAGVRSTAIWIVYVVFVVLYGLWSVRLAGRFAGDRRLGYLLCFTDAAVLLPLVTWTPTVAMRISLLVLCGCGVAVSYWAARVEERAASRHSVRVQARNGQWKAPDSEDSDPETRLERAVRIRLRVFTTTGARFGLVVLRILRFEETASYYGGEVSQRILSAVSRRGLRLLGPDAQHFILPGGRVAFLFETEPDRSGGRDGGEDRFKWTDPYDVEGLAMTVGRKACDHLIDGHRVECVVGWASAPADGLNADDLMYTAESGAQSTAAFRRVTGAPVPLPERERAAAG